jgi:hypothetical protein
MLTPGDIILYSNFSFDDGRIKDKFFIVLHKNPCLALITTSNNLRYPMVKDIGCNVQKMTFFLPAGRHRVFSKPTYLVMTKIWEFDISVVKKKIDKSIITKKTPLTSKLLVDILDCLKNFYEDISTEHWNYIFSETPSKDSLNDLLNKFNKRL